MTNLEKWRQSSAYPCKHCDKAFNCPFAHRSVNWREAICQTFFYLHLKLKEESYKNSVQHPALRNAYELLKNLPDYRLN